MVLMFILVFSNWGSDFTFFYSSRDKLFLFWSHYIWLLIKFYLNFLVIKDCTIFKLPNPEVSWSTYCSLQKFFLKSWKNFLTLYCSNLLYSYTVRVNMTQFITYSIHLRSYKEYLDCYENLFYYWKFTYYLKVLQENKNNFGSNRSEQNSRVKKLFFQNLIKG